MEKIKVAELAEDFLQDYRINGLKSLDDAEARWRLHLQEWFGHLRAAHVGTDTIKGYIEKRQQEKASSATINRELAALKRMFSLGMKSTPPKVYRLPAIPHLKENNVRKGFLTIERYARLADACASEQCSKLDIRSVGASPNLRGCASNKSTWAAVASC